MDLLIRNGRVVDPAQQIDETLDVSCSGAKILRLGKKLPVPSPRTEIIDARGLVVTPGWIDAHCHLREPGREDEESIASGAAAAASGGFTTLMAMPNTTPCIDNAALVAFVLNEGARTPVRVLPIGAITRDRAGKELTEMAEMAERGAVAFSDDGNCLADSRILRRALEYSRLAGRPLIDHPEDPALSRNGAMNEGTLSTRLGLAGIPREAEEIAVSRDIALAGLTGGPLHLAHLTTAGSVELVRQGKKKGLPVTAEVTVHHLTLTEAAVSGYDTNAKVSPPLRTAADIKALRKGLRDGTIDIIVTDHAPHSVEEKETDFQNAACGMIGLQTALPLVNELAGEIPLAVLVAGLTCNPARIFGLKECGSLQPGYRADLAIYDPESSWVLTPELILSRSRNTPFLGRRLKGRLVRTVCGGRTVFKA
ncbi:MAG TPA: dihydroorotase [bacterium]|nr:dihydroorotase [bacterium]